MPRASKYEPTLKERIAVIKKAGLVNQENKAVESVPESMEALDSLSNRLKEILGIVRSKPIKATEMIYLIMYDIEDDKVRREIAKHLIRKGCRRIQHSVFLARTEPERFHELSATLKDINEMYDNSDSILLVPVNVSDVRSMKIIGKQLALETLVDPPNTLFF